MRKELSPSLLIFLIILFSLSCTRSHKSIEEFPKPEAKLYGKTVVYVPESLAEQFVMVEKGEGESEKYDFGKDVVDVTRQVFQIYFYDVEIIIGESRKPDLLGTSQYFFEINGIVRCFNASPKRDYPKNYSYNPKSGQTSSSFSDHLLGAFFDSVIKDLPYAGPREYISRPPQPKPPRRPLSRHRPGRSRSTTALLSTTTTSADFRARASPCAWPRVRMPRCSVACGKASGSR